MKVILMSPLCSPKQSGQPGDTVEVSNKLGKAMIEQRTAKPWVDPKAAEKARAKARADAIDKLDEGLDKDIAGVQEQLRKDSNQPGANKADLMVAADEAIAQLRANHEATTSAL